MVSVLFNLGFIFAGIAVVAFRPEWLAFHLILADRIAELRLLALAAVVAPPAIARCATRAWDASAETPLDCRTSRFRRSTVSSRSSARGSE